MKKIQTNKRTSIKKKLIKMSMSSFLPLILLCIFILAIFLFYSFQYSKLSSNVATVSRFNMNFKDDVDLNMYYYVAGNEKALSLDEVEEAKQLAQTLLNTTKSKASGSAIRSVLNLCDNLSRCISEIVETDGYDLRVSKLENNIYVITALIQKYMYTYLYYEAGELASIQTQMNVWLMMTVLVIAFFMLIIIFFSVRTGFHVSRSITQPIDRLYRRVQEISQGDLTVKPPVEAQDDKLQTLSEALEEMVSQLGTQIDLNRQEQIRLRSMELSLIQAQVNPHFLYNTLDAMVWLVEDGKKDEAVEMICSLSTYFRSFLSNGKQIITLREEKLHIQSYLEIQQMRYKDTLRYELDMNPIIDNCRIPKMTLQPLVENAIYHGINPTRTTGKITIRTQLRDNHVNITISDTGMGMSAETLAQIRSLLESDKATGFGIFSCYQRLKLTFGNDFTFLIDSKETSGTTIRIRIPYTTAVEEDT